MEDTNNSGGGASEVSRRPNSTTAAVPTLRQLFYYSQRDPAATAASPSGGLRLTPERKAKEEEEGHRSAAAAPPRNALLAEAAHSRYNPFNQPTLVERDETARHQREQHLEEGAEAGSPCSADDDADAEEDVVAPSARMSAHLHDFFQHNVVMPYTFREKAMHPERLGWVPEQARLVPATQDRLPQRKQPSHRRLPLSLPTRAPRHREWPPLYVAPDGSNRYRKIEDLALYVRTGALTTETNYFRDPMQRRLHEEVIFLAPQQKVIPSEDPRMDRIWTDEGKKNRAAAKLQSIIPKKAQLCKLKHDHSTGLVKPYALGKSAHVASAQPFSEFAIESAMESYVTTMQCQRPNKGVRGPMLDE